MEGRDLQQTGGVAAFQLHLPPAGRRGWRLASRLRSIRHHRQLTRQNT